MNAATNGYRTVELPGARRVVTAMLDLASWQHYIFGLLEVDVTAARCALAAYQERTGERISFTGYLAFCLARAIEADKSVQAYRQGRNKLVLFDDVDVGMMVEHRWGETRAPVGHVLRRANGKTLLEIHHEIRAIQEGPPPARSQMPGWLRLLLQLPWPLSKLLLACIGWLLQRDPVGTFVPLMGTVGITAVGMFGKRGGWGLAAPNGHTLSVIVGGIGRKPVAVEGPSPLGREEEEHVEVREVLSLTLAFDHRVVDGAPAARFSQRLVELIEGGCGLETLTQGDER